MQKLSRCAPVSFPLLSFSQVNKLIDRSKENTFTAGVLKNDGSTGKSLGRRSTLTWLRDSETEFSDVFMDVNLALQVTADRYGFKINPVEAMQLTTYDRGGLYRWHYDNAIPGDKRLLSISIELQQATFGGGISFLPMSGNFWEGREHCGDVGSATIFPTYLLHQANPVWWGQRIALIAWANERD